MAPKAKAGGGADKRKRKKPPMDEFFDAFLESSRQPAPRNDDEKEEAALVKLARLFSLSELVNSGHQLELATLLDLKNEDIIYQLDRRITSHLEKMHEQISGELVQGPIEQCDSTESIPCGFGPMVGKKLLINTVLQIMSNPNISREEKMEQTDKFRPENQPQPAPPPAKESTPLARFTPDFEDFDDEEATSVRNIYQARCDLLGDRCMEVSGSAATSKGDIVAMAGGAGYRERSPLMEVWMHKSEEAKEEEARERQERQVHTAFASLRHDPEEDNYTSFCKNPGFWAPGHATCPDKERNLVWTCGDERIKAFSVDEDESACKHTLYAGGRVNGVTVSGSKLYASSRKKVLYWKLDEIEEHKKDVTGAWLEEKMENSRTTEEEKERLNKKYVNWVYGHELDNDYLHKVEVSRGAKPHGSFSLGFPVDRLLALPSNVSGFEGSAAATKENGYGVYICDLENAAIKTRLFGHTDTVQQMSFSAGLPNMLASASLDSTIKIWDLRSKKAECTLQGLLDYHQYAVALVSAEGGYPFCFSGGTNQSILAWDLRMQRCLYELSAGNNRVKALYWDEAQQSLLAVTHCEYMGQNGGIGYEPTYEYTDGSEGMYDDEDQFHDCEDEDEMEEERVQNRDEKEEPYMWPGRCPHGPKEFPITWDAGQSFFIRYMFKQNPSHKIPEAYMQEW